MKKYITSSVKTIVIVLLVLIAAGAFSQESIKASTGNPYANMPAIAPIGEHIERYLPISESAKGAAINPAKGYRVQELGKGLYMITDNAYQSLFMVYETGVVVIDAPPPFAQHILQAIKEVTNKPITHLIYSHSHTDHIGGTRILDVDKQVAIIAHEETKRLLLRAKDPNRSIPTVTFK